MEGCLMKRILVIALAVMLIMTAVLPTVSSAMAAGKKKVVYIVNVDNDGVRARSAPEGGDNVITSLPKGTKLFYLGKSGAYYKVCSEFGPTSGYIYSGYASYYGAVAYDNIYKADGRTRVYSRPSTTSRRVGTLKDNQFVIVYAVSGKWAYVHTISGTKGYVKTSQLEDID